MSQASNSLAGCCRCISGPGVKRLQIGGVSESSDAYLNRVLNIDAFGRRVEGSYKHVVIGASLNPAAAVDPR